MFRAGVLVSPGSSPAGPESAGCLCPGLLPSLSKKEHRDGRISRKQRRSRRRPVPVSGVFPVGQPAWPCSELLAAGFVSHGNLLLSLTCCLRHITPSLPPGGPCLLPRIAGQFPWLIPDTSGKSSQTRMSPSQDPSPFSWATSGEVLPVFPCPSEVQLS